MRYSIMLFILFFLFPSGGKCNIIQIPPDDTVFVFTENLPGCVASDTILIGQKTKGEALFWWALGGVVGLHRIYLGTSPVVPVFYAVTLGGGMGLLAVADLLAILLVKDINCYADNPGILMFMTGEKTKKLPSAD